MSSDNGSLLHDGGPMRVGSEIYVMRPLCTEGSAVHHPWATLPLLCSRCLVTAKGTYNDKPFSFNVAMVSLLSPVVYDDDFDRLCRGDCIYGAMYTRILACM